jgi:hypothetical protein
MKIALDDVSIDTFIRETYGPEKPITPELREKVRQKLSTYTSEIKLWLDKKRIAETYWKPRTPKSLQRWYPGGDSNFGFLDWGQSLEKIITQDNATLARLGLKHDEIAQRLKSVLDSIDPFSGREMVVENVRIKTNIFVGYQICPFDGCQFRTKACPHSHSHINLLRNETSGQEAQNIPGMMWHLIGEHQFFEGGYFRTDPEQLARILFD